MAKLRNILILLSLGVALFGCGESELAVTEPEGGYQSFRNALLMGDSGTLWECLSEDTKSIYRDALSDLNAISESINLLSPSDQIIARDRTGVVLLTRASNAEELFETLLHLENIIGDQGFTIGSELEELIVVGDEAKVTTRAEQEFELIREEDGVWRVTTFLPLARNRLSSITENLMAVETMVAESAYRRRSHEEIMSLLGGTVETTSEVPEDISEESSE